MDDKQNNTSLLYFKSGWDVLGRLCFVGIFVVENVMHLIYFETEMENLVYPAWRPLPRSIAVIVHSLHIILGLIGAILVLISGFDSAGRSALKRGSQMMVIFMLSITWTWWINRQGVPYWHVPFDDISVNGRRNRMIHILKNISIFGALLSLQRLAKYDMNRFPSLMSGLEGLVRSLRPWSFPSSLMPMLVLSAILTARHPLLTFHSYTSTIAVIGGTLALQSGANLLNSYYDYSHGCDTLTRKGGDRTLVDRQITPTVCLVLSMVLFLVWAGCYGYVARFVLHRQVLQAFGTLCVIGMSLAVGYSCGPIPLKYYGLGDITIYLCFGPVLLIACALIWICPEEVSSLPLLDMVCLSCPVTLLVVAILHVNNIRDIEADERAGAITLAVRLGLSRSLLYLDIILFLAFALSLLLAGVFRCYGLLLSLVTLPRVLWMRQLVRRNRLKTDIDEDMAKTMVFFAIATACGISVMPHTEYHQIGCYFTIGLNTALQLLL
mmetsp:Transcript_25256/g.25486  ORF Transcript_25256/g.25486 Transcript_25256/m.25486 type:complete len:494 (-) Transcript_25256:34-1515(-)